MSQSNRNVPHPHRELISNSRQLPNKSKGKKKAKKKNNKGAVRIPSKITASSNAPYFNHEVNYRVPKLFTGIQRRQAMQMMLPEKAGSDFVLQAAQAPSSMCVRHFSRSFNITGATHPGGFSVVMFPDLYRPCYHTSSTAVTLPAAALGPVVLRSDRVEFESLGTMRSSQLWTLGCTNAGIDNTSESISDAIIDSAASMKYGFNLVPNPVAQTITYSVSDATKKAGVPHVLSLYYKIAGGAWISLNDVTLQEGDLTTRSVNLPANAVAIAWSATAASTGMIFKISVGLPLTQITTNAAYTMSPPFEQSVEELEVEFGRVVGLALLIKNTSSDLYNGGNIMAGRVPKSYNPWTGGANDLSQLMDNRRYIGMAKYGAYTWWMPSELSEVSVDQPDKLVKVYSESEYLFAQLNGWSAQSSVEVQAHWVVEFNSKKQLFEKKQTPIWTDSYATMRSILLSVPAASCNPEHESLFKEYANKAIDAGKSTVNWVAEHKDALLSAMALLSELAA